MVTLRLFAQAREAAGTGTVDIEGETVAAVLKAATTRFGPDFAAVVQQCRVWVDGEPAELETSVVGSEELALLPPVSGG